MFTASLQGVKDEYEFDVIGNFETVEIAMRESKKYAETNELGNLNFINVFGDNWSSKTNDNSKFIGIYKST